MATLALVLTACDGRAVSVPTTLSVLDAPLTRGVSPAITAGTDGTLHFAWVTLDSSDRGHLMTMADGSAPNELVDPLGSAQFDGETPPKLQTAPDGSLMLSYAVTVPDSTAKYKALSGLRFVRSTDGGATWSTPSTIADDGDLGRYRNDHTMHIARDGGVYVAWLDERTAENVRVFVARSDDHGMTWTRNVAIDMDEACGCCRTPITTGPDGTVYTIWRKILPGGIRDMVVARSNDKGVTWSSPIRVHADSFAINSCPDAGASIAVDDANRLHVTWWTGREGGAGVKHTYSDDGGVTFSQPVKLGVAEFSKAAHAQLALIDANRVAVTWDDGTIKPARIALRVSNDRGASFDSVRYLSGVDAAAAFPVLAVTGRKLAVVWQEKGDAGAPAATTAAPVAAAYWRPYAGTGPVRLVRYDATLP